MLRLLLILLQMMITESCLVRMRVYQQYIRYITPAYDTPQNSSVSSSQTCGQSRNLSPARILGGDTVSYGQYPWTAILSISGAQDTMCTGSLVSQQHVLTAGHCVQVKGVQVEVVLGELDFMNRLEGQEILQFTAVKIFLHPDYRGSVGVSDQAPRYDLAILLLDRPVQSSVIIPVCLPPPGMVIRQGTMATVAGWGRTSSFTTSSSTTSSSSLQAAQVMVLTREECVNQPGSSPPLNDQLCAGVSGARQGPCPGDSGGPLLVPGQGGGGDWVVVGVVSHGPQVCGLTPVIYSSVSHSRGWIDSVINQP